MSAHPSSDRRKFLLATSAALVSFSFEPRHAEAQEVAAARNAGHYRFRIGDIKATVISDGTLSGSVRIYAGSAPADDLQRTLSEAFLPTDNLTINLNTLLLEIGDRKVLVEAGAAKTMGPNGGALFPNLAAIGVRPEQIDAVVVTHTHPDHVGNLRREDGRLAFPNAAIHVPAADWDFFVRNEPDLSRLPMAEDFRAASLRRSNAVSSQSPGPQSCINQGARSFRA